MNAAKKDIKMSFTKPGSLYVTTLILLDVEVISLARDETYNNHVQTFLTSSQPRAFKIVSTPSTCAIPTGLIAFNEKIERKTQRK